MFQFLKEKVSHTLENLHTSSFPFNVGEEVRSYAGESIWTLHHGTAKSDGAPVSIFAFDVKNGVEHELTAARNGIKRFKTVRHPNVLRFIEGVETDTHVYIVTEPVKPLKDTLEEIKLTPGFLAWGLHQLASAVSFVTNDVKLIHENICPSSVFVTRAGDWKLGGLELLVDPRDSDSFLKFGNVMPDKYKPPELVKSQYVQIQSQPIFSVDVYSLGCFIFEIFNGPFNSPDDFSMTRGIPHELSGAFRQMVNAVPNQRPNPKAILENQFFKNKLVEAHLFLENIALKDAAEKDNFFKELPGLIESRCIPTMSAKYKIVPLLTNALEYGAGTSKALPPLLKLGTLLSDEEFGKMITPSLIKLFASKDRATRVFLLQNIESFAHQLSNDMVEKNVWGHVEQGFADSSPVLRELTVKSTLHLAPKLKQATLGGPVLRHFAKLQVDEEPGIRTNTTICLGKVAQYFNESTRQKVLIPAFSRALKDQFPPARVAAVMSFSATQSYYSLEDIATKVIPTISCLAVDPTKDVRTAVSKTIKTLLKKIEDEADQIAPPPSSETPQESGNEAAAASTMKSMLKSDGMLGWAVGAVKSISTTGGTGAANPALVAPQPAPAVSSAPGTMTTAQPSSIAASNPAQAQRGPAMNSMATPAPKPAAPAGGGSSVNDLLNAMASSSVSAAAPTGSPSANGWGEWDEGLDDLMSSSTPAAQPTMTATTTLPSAGGWGDSDDWGSGWDDNSNSLMDAKPAAPAPAASDPLADLLGGSMTGPVAAAPTAASGEGLSRLELAQKRKEERKLRAASGASSTGEVRKPGRMTLGAKKL